MEHTGELLRAQSQVSPASWAPHKSEYLFWRNTHFQKNAYFLETFKTLQWKNTFWPGLQLALIALAS